MSLEVIEEHHPGDAVEGHNSIFPAGPPPLGGAWPVEKTQATHITCTMSLCIYGIQEQCFPT